MTSLVCCMCFKRIIGNRAETKGIYIFQILGLSTLCSCIQEHNLVTKYMRSLWGSDRNYDARALFLQPWSRGVEGEQTCSALHYSRIMELCGHVL